ncbi:MAG: DUF2007 domain-containing protein [Desulfuromonas sp.]|nr:MAG: DUF2007 domain-containing protein [Desulfuromonas sp.]
MKRLYRFSPWQRIDAAIWRDRLEQEGIPCILRNEELFAALGEIPFLELQPELWVVDDEMLPRAERLLDHWQEATEQPPWRCPNCGEEHEGMFDACWQCGRRRDDD